MELDGVSFVLLEYLAEFKSLTEPINVNYTHFKPDNVNDVIEVRSHVLVEEEFHVLIPCLETLHTTIQVMIRQ